MAFHKRNIFYYENKLLDACIIKIKNWNMNGNEEQKYSFYSDLRFARICLEIFFRKFWANFRKNKLREAIKIYFGLFESFFRKIGRIVPKRGF